MNNQVISHFKLELEHRADLLVSLSREEMEIERSMWSKEDDSYGIHYEAAIKLAAKAEGLREAIKRLDAILGNKPLPIIQKIAKDPFDL